MITRIEIDGFKSFSNFQMEFTPLTIIAGTNASGKSNLFDALHLLSSLATNDLRTAFTNKGLRGEIKELFTQFNDKEFVNKMQFAVELLVERSVEDNWGGEATIKTPRMRYELTIARKMNSKGFEELSVEHEELSKISTDKDDWAKKYLGSTKKDIWKNALAGGSSKPYIYTEQQNGIPTIKIRQDGKQGGRATAANSINQTVLGSVSSVDFPHVLAAKKEISSWNFMQLNPEVLREPTKYEANFSDIIGHSGENLAAALFRIKSEDEYNMHLISKELSAFIPDYKKVNVEDDTTNKQFIIKLLNESGKEFTSRVLSEGTLRLLALCILLYDNKYQGLLCFEEPENGIHPFRIGAMVDLLRSLSTSFSEEDLLRQVIVNTHSPSLLRKLRERSETDKNVCIWFSKLVTRITEIGNERVKMKITKITPLTKESQQSFLTDKIITDAEIKMTVADAAIYLETTNS